MKYIVVSPDDDLVLQTTENDDEDTSENRRLVSSRVVSGRVIFIDSGELPKIEEIIWHHDSSEFDFVPTNIVMPSGEEYLESLPVNHKEERTPEQIDQDNSAFLARLNDERRTAMEQMNFSLD